jgi:hypothetical protein
MSPVFGYSKVYGRGLKGFLLNLLESDCLQDTLHTSCTVSRNCTATAKASLLISLRRFECLVPPILARGFGHSTVVQKRPTPNRSTKASVNIR